MVECAVCGEALRGDVDPEGLCEHAIAWSDGNTLVSPLEGLELPWLSREAVGKRWPDRRVAEAFGELAPLVDEYTALADWRPGMSARVLWPLLAEFLATPIAAVGAAVEDGPVSTGLTGRPGRTVGAHNQPVTYWVTPEPERAAEEARALVALLRQGYGYLEDLAGRATTDERRVA